MMKMRPRTRIALRGSGLAALTLLVTLALGSLGAGRAAAYIGGCDTDPVLVLSDGRMVTVTTAIADPPKDIVAVVFSLHAPVGVTLAHVHSWGRLHRIEQIQVSSDQAPGSYRVETTVHTGAPGVAVTATATLTDMTLGVVLDAQVLTGSSGQTIALSLAG